MSNLRSSVRYEYFILEDSYLVNQRPLLHDDVIFEHSLTQRHQAVANNGENVEGYTTTKANPIYQNVENLF